MTIQTELIMELHVQVGQAYVIGDTPNGYMRVIPITGGVFKGPNLDGIILPGGADWNLKSPDGTGELWARYTIKENDGTLISVLNKGDTFPEGYSIRGFNDNEYKDLSTYVRTTPIFEVAFGKHEWLNYLTFVGTKKRHPQGGVHLHFYSIK